MSTRCRRRSYVDARPSCQRPKGISSAVFVGGGARNDERERPQPVALSTKSGKKGRFMDENGIDVTGVEGWLRSSTA
jgi:hypothetical protein